MRAATGRATRQGSPGAGQWVGEDPDGRWPVLWSTPGTCRGLQGRRAEPLLSPPLRRSGAALPRLTQPPQGEAFTPVGPHNSCPETQSAPEHGSFYKASDVALLLTRCISGVTMVRAASTVTVSKDAGMRHEVMTLCRG